MEEENAEQREAKVVRLVELRLALDGVCADADALGADCGELGAEVTKVEAVGRGDLARGLGPSPELSAQGMGISFLAQNAGKQSLTLNLKTDDGKTILKQLVQASDVLVENFRPGVMDRLGVGSDVLRAENPRLIYCAISGFGQTGPWADRPAYDQIIQGAAGVMDVTGTPENGPTRVGYPLADTVGGLTAAMAITASGCMWSTCCLGT